MNTQVSSPKKVLFVITKSNWGGAQRYVFDLATNLPKEQFEVVVAFGGTGGKAASTGKLEQKLHEAGVRTIFVKSFMRDVSLLRDWRALGELRKIFKEESPDIVHLNSPKAGVMGSIAGRFARVPRIIYTAHGWPFWEDRNIFFRAFLWLCSYSTVLFSHMTICISDYDLHVTKYMPFARNKVAWIYNGIAPMTFSPGDIIRNTFPPGVTITGNIGELIKNKNQQALIEEAKNKPEMYIAIVGEGEDRTMLEEKIKKYNLGERVKLFGFIPAAEALKGFDIFALPSIKEGLPYVLLEARAAGLPIVANRVGGVGEILDAKDMQEFSLERMVEKTAAIYRKAS